MTTTIAVEDFESYLDVPRMSDRRGARTPAQYMFGTSEGTNRKEGLFADWRISARDVRAALSRAL